MDPVRAAWTLMRGYEDPRYGLEIALFGNLCGSSAVHDYSCSYLMHDLREYLGVTLLFDYRQKMIE